MLCQCRIGPGCNAIAVVHPGQHAREIVASGRALAVKEVDRVVQPPLGLALEDGVRCDTGRDDLVVELEAIGLWGSEVTC